jgi:hypothetical protein
MRERLYQVLAGVVGAVLWQQFGNYVIALLVAVVWYLAAPARWWWRRRRAGTSSKG